MESSICEPNTPGTPYNRKQTPESPAIPMREMEWCPILTGAQAISLREALVRQEEAASPLAGAVVGRGRAAAIFLFVVDIFEQRERNDCCRSAAEASNQQHHCHDPALGVPRSPCRCIRCFILFVCQLRELLLTNMHT